MTPTACDVTVRIEPSPGLHLVPYGPYAFLPTPNAAISYDAPPGKMMARERLRVVTCDAETFKSEIQPIAIALSPRLPPG